jgi:very-short-patch-repair endonuclease
LKDEDKQIVRFGELNDEEKIYINQSWKKICYLDFKLKDYIIEFDGIYWHKDKEEYDAKRDKYLIQNFKYKILRITDLEYYNNKKATIKKCLQFLGYEDN